MATSEQLREVYTSRKDQGFSVLEAIVAMAILSIALLPILNMQMQFTKTVEGLERVERKLSVRDSTLHYLKSVNLTQAREGGFKQNGHTVTWTSTPFIPSRTAKSFGGQEGRFDITLYTVTVIVTTTANQKRVDQFEVRGLGWKSTQAYVDL